MPVFRRGLLVLPMLALAGATPPPSLPTDNPKVLNDLFQCRAIAEDAARLACFDEATAQLATAADQGDVRVVDKEQVNRTRRALFGFSLPSLDLFAPHKSGTAKSGHDKGDEDEIKEITAKIAGVGTSGDGSYVLTLDDGSRWEQTDGVSLGRTPRAGNAVTVKRGALGSYKMEIEKGPAMKVRRIG
jgi:hypothetical protein